MSLDIANIWRESKGIGRLSYNFRTLAYAAAGIIVVTYHIQNNLPLGFLEYFTLSFILIVPAWLLYVFVKNGKHTRYIIWGLSCDFFCVGWVIGLIDLCFLPSAVFFVSVVTNHIAARGFNQIYRTLILPLGALITFTLGGFQINFDSTPLLKYLTFGYGIIHYVANSYVLAAAIRRVKSQNQEIKKQRMEIEEKSEELRVFNDSLKKLNTTLEQKVARRTKELEIKNEKLKEYAFVNSHKLRAPVVRILGLVNLLDYKNIYDSELIVTELKNAAMELDEMTKDIDVILEAGSTRYR